MEQKQDFARPHWGVWFKPAYQEEQTMTEGISIDSVIAERDRLREINSFLRQDKKELLAACRAIQEWADAHRVGIPVRCGLRDAIALAEKETE